jgi:hypothetical protein
MNTLLKEDYIARPMRAPAVEQVAPRVVIESKLIGFFIPDLW